jgi:hypothetical protein
MGRKTQTSGASKDNGKKKSKADKTAKKSKSSSSPSSPPSSPEIARASIPEKKLLTAGHGIQMTANAVSRPANGDSTANNVLQQKATILSNQGGMVSLNSMKPGLAGPSRPEMIIPKRIAPEQQKPFKSLRSLTISNMNPNAKAELFQEFLMKVFVRAGGAIERTGNPIVGIEENFAKQGTAQVEFRSIEESLAGLSLQGINYGGKNIQVRRANESPNMANILGTRPVPVLDENYLKNLRVSAQVKDHADKLRVANLPVHLDEEDILSQIATLGALQEFYLVRDLQEFRSKGFAWARFADSVATNRALVTKTFIDKTLITIRRVNEPLGAEKPATRKELRKKSVSRSSSSSSSCKRRKSSSSSSDRSLPPEAKKIIVGKRTVEIDPREKRMTTSCRHQDRYPFRFS